MAVLEVGDVLGENLVVEDVLGDNLVVVGCVLVEGPNEAGIELGLVVEVEVPEFARESRVPSSVPFSSSSVVSAVKVLES